jgi:predicted permease
VIRLPQLMLLRLVSLLVPHAVRLRWREEWLAEMHHARARGASRRVLWRMTAGSVADALAVRRIGAPARTSAPRAGVFHALDQDLHYALRGLANAPGFAFSVILSLAIGIGANAAAFSLINAAIFRPFPGVSDQDSLVRLTLGTQDRQKFSTIEASYRDFLSMRENMTTLSGLSAHRDATFAVATEGQTAGVSGAVVSGNYFEVLGVIPAAGRFFLDREDETAWTHPVVVIGDALWERLYDRDRSAIGRRLLVNGAALEIVGVAPRGFIGVRKHSPGLWIPMAMGELVLRGPDGRPARAEVAGPLSLEYVGRRRDGVTMEQVAAQAGTLSERLDATRSNPRARVSVLPVLLNDPSGIGAQIVGFMAVPMLVLAIACVNAANLVMARSSRRVRDWTVRLAVGATRWRVVRQVLAEAIILSAAATMLGLLLSRWGVSFITRILPIPVPLDVRVAMFTVAIAALTAITFSLGPALAVTRYARQRLASATVGAGMGTRSRTRFALVALQAALSLGLLATGTQFARTVYAAAATEPVAHPESLVVAAVDVDPLRLKAEAGEEFYRQLLDRVNRLPGVVAAGFAPRGIVTGQVGRDTLTRIWVPGFADDGRSQVAFRVSARLLDAIAVRVLQGRGFTAADEMSVRTVIVNTAFADKFLHGQAINRTFRVGRPAGTSRDGGLVIVALGTKGEPTYRTSAPSSPTDGTDVTVVGVVDGLMQQGAFEPPILYYAAPLVYQPERTLFLRLDRSGRFNAASLHAAARDVDPRVPITGVTTLADMRLNHNVDVKFVGRAVGVLGILALMLAAGGLYSVVSYIVSLRRQEVGIRIALGAGAGSIVGMIVRQALLPTLIGAAAGAGGAAAVGAVIRSRMYGASTVDPVAFGSATLLMLVVMLLASWLPARHAGSVDPISVLRQE